MTLRIASTVFAVLFVLGATSGDVIGSTPEAKQTAEAIANAHGGTERWAKLSTLSIDRVHHMFRDEKPFAFRIIGEYSTHRVYQRWSDPAGEVVWDGERAWSNAWGFRGRFSERFTTSIGFFLANMPWLLLESDTEFVSLSRGGFSIPGDDRDYWLLEIEYEAEPVRKPKAIDATRDRFGIVVDPATFRIRAVVERRSYAGQLDYSGAPAEQDHFADIFVIESYVDNGGLLWPGEYSLYTLAGQKYGEGRFFNYETNVPLEESWFVPVTGAEGSDFDTTSSYLRAATAE